VRQKPGKQKKSVIPSYSGEAGARSGSRCNFKRCSLELGEELRKETPKGIQNNLNEQTFQQGCRSRRGRADQKTFKWLVKVHRGGKGWQLKFGGLVGGEIVGGDGLKLAGLGEVEVGPRGGGGGSSIPVQFRGGRTESGRKSKAGPP